MKVEPEEIRRKARTARENGLNTSKGEEYLEKQIELAKEQYGKLLKICPDDIEAKIYCAYYEANEAVNIQAQHEPAAKKMMEALDVFAEDLKTSSLSLEEKEALIGDITTRVMVLAKDYNYQGVMLSLLMLGIGGKISEKFITDGLADIEAEFANSTALTTRMAGLLLGYPEGFKSTTIRASVVVACQAGLELLVESPGFALADCFDSSNQKLTVLLDAMQVIDPAGYHYIPSPKYSWCDYEAFTDLRKTLKKNFDHSQIGQKVKQHNAKVRDLERAVLRKINREKTDKYWQEYPNRPKEINDEIENVRQTIKQNDDKIKELNQQCKAAEAECDREPIPASAEKKKLQQQIKTLEEQRTTLGFFQFSEKSQVKKELKMAQAAYEQAQRDEPVQKQQKKEKKSRVVKEYQQKIEQVKKDNERLGKRLNSLRKELDNPLGLDPL